MIYNNYKNDTNSNANLNVASPILCLPAGVRIYILGLAGIGGKLRTESPVWTCVYPEKTPKKSSLELEDEGLYQLSPEATHQLFYHPLFFVSKQIRLEAQCALVKYNKIGFVASPEQLAWLTNWNRQILRSLRDLVIIPWDIPTLHLAASFIKENCDIPKMSISIHDSAHIDTLWEERDHGESEYMARQVEPYEACSDSYKNFAGVKDFFVYLLWQLDDEPMYERIVMGESYDSLKRRKLKPSEREPTMPWCKRKRQIGYDHLYRYSWEPPIPYIDKGLNIGRLSSIYG